MQKNVFLVTLALLLPFLPLLAQQASCCSPANQGVAVAPPSATSQFAHLGTDNAFVKSHDEPLPYQYQGVAEPVEYETPDGKTARAFAYLTKEKSTKYLFVFHEWWGLNGYIKQEAEKYFKELENVNVIALDLYDGKVAETQQEAQQYMQAVSEDRARAIIQGAVQLAGPAAEIGTVGWCFGGGWALQAAIIAEEQAAAAVMYYGMPEQDVSRLRKLECPVLGIFASQDGWITPEVVQEFEQNMKEAGEALTVQMYDAPHAFANPSNPKYDQQAANEAHALAVRFLNIHL